MQIISNLMISREQQQQDVTTHSTQFQTLLTRNTWSSMSSLTMKTKQKEEYKQTSVVTGTRLHVR